MNKTETGTAVGATFTIYQRWKKTFPMFIQNCSAIMDLHFRKQHNVFFDKICSYCGTVFTDPISFQKYLKQGHGTPRPGKSVNLETQKRKKLYAMEY